MFKVGAINAKAANRSSSETPTADCDARNSVVNKGSDFGHCALRERSNEPRITKPFSQPKYQVRFQYFFTQQIQQFSPQKFDLFRCWLESSFVGTKPLESPQTPALENSFVHSHKINIGPMSVTATNYDAIRINGGESSVI